MPPSRMSPGDNFRKRPPRRSRPTHGSPNLARVLGVIGSHLQARHRLDVEPRDADLGVVALVDLHFVQNFA